MNIDASQIKLYSTDWSPRKTSDRKHLETTIFQERLTHPKNKIYLHNTGNNMEQHFKKNTPCVSKTKPKHPKNSSETYHLHVPATLFVSLPAPHRPPPAPPSPPSRWGLPASPPAPAQCPASRRKERRGRSTGSSRSWGEKVRCKSWSNCLGVAQFYWGKSGEKDDALENPDLFGGSYKTTGKDLDFGEFVDGNCGFKDWENSGKTL